MPIPLAGVWAILQALALIALRKALDVRRAKDDSLATERNVNNARHRR
jgi:hypothetical protein